MSTDPRPRHELHIAMTLDARLERQLEDRRAVTATAERHGERQVELPGRGEA